MRFSLPRVEPNPSTKVDARQRAVLIAFFPALLGDNPRGPGAGDKNTWIASTRCYTYVIAI
jgi:hypothetical protein